MRKSGPGTGEYCPPEVRDAGRKNLLTPAVFLVFLILFFFISASAWAQPGKFTPRISYYRGDLDLEFFDETHKDRFRSRPAQTRSETAFIEKITLTASGFVYHPRFIIFRGKLTGGLMQGKFEYSSFDDKGSWDMITAIGYNFRMTVLPEHPYTLELHSTRSAFVSKGSLRYGTAPVHQVHGISLQYRKKPYFARVSYDLTKTESFLTDTDGNKFGVSAGHVIGIMTTNAAYTRSSSTVSSSRFRAENDTDSFSLHNRTGYSRYRLSSRLELQNYRQTTSTDTFLDTERFSLDELLEIDLPWNFRSQFRYRHSKYDSETEKRKSTSTTDNANGRISHRLFRSLDTSYSIDYMKMKFDAAESRRLAHLFTLYYHKQIPWGSMSAGLNLGLGRTERSGTAVISHEVHSAAVLSDIVLNSANIDEILSVDVKDPETGLFFPLQAGDFRLTQIGSITLITVLAVPAIVADIDPLTAYEFQIFYRVLPQDLTVRERNVGYNLNMTLFNGMVSPYYSRTTFRQELISGTLGGEPTERTTDTVGVTLRRTPFTLRLEYQDSESDRDTTKKSRADLLFDKAVSRTVTVFGRANYYNDKYESLSNETKVIETGAGIGFRKAFTRTRINLSSSVHYARRSGDAEGYSYYFNSNLSWNIRRTNLVLGATFSHAESESRLARHERDYQYIYLKAKRQIF
jgi:hypothetical protein